MDSADELKQVSRQLALARKELDESIKAMSGLWDMIDIMLANATPSEREAIMKSLRSLRKFARPGHYGFLTKALENLLED